MAESGSSRKIQKLVPDSDMPVAAQQLLLLSDQEDSNSNSISINISSSSSSNVKKISSYDHQEEIDQRSRFEISKQKKIEEIFGTEEEVHRPKKRRYRSLASIYQATKPIRR